MESYSLITSLVTGFGLALPFGYVAERFLRAPALVGYILAGLSVTVIPGLPPVSADMISQLAEIGVMLLMFGVGLHFSVRDLLRVKGVALPGAALQMMGAAALGAAVAVWLWHWTIGAAVLFGFTISCASTVVVTKALDLRKLTAQMDGRVAIGWLVMEDLASVVLLVCLPPFAAAVEGGADFSVAGVLVEVAKTLAWAAVFVVLMLVAGRRVVPWLLREVAMTGSRELFTLTVLGCAIVIAYGAGAIFDVSFALGAFFAGMVMQESRYAHRAAQNSLPLQDAFSVLFFVSVGLMLDWRIFLERPWEILLVVLIIVVGKFLLSSAIVLALRWPLHTALTVGACLGQIGEFSFILAGQGISLKLVDQSVMSVIVAASIVTIAFNPVLFWAAPHLEGLLARHSKRALKWAQRSTPFERLPENTPREMLDGQAIVVGCSEVARGLLKEFARSARRTIVICSSSDPIEELRAEGFGVIVGEPSDPTALAQAHAATAGVLVIPSGTPADALRILSAARAINPTLPVVIRLSGMEGASLFDSEDRNLFLVCEPLVTSLTLTGVAMEQLVRGEESEDAGRETIQSVRDMLDAEYRRSVAAVQGGAEEAPGAGEKSLDAAARVASEAMASVKAARERGDLDGRGAFTAGARRLGAAVSRWLSGGARKDPKKDPETDPRGKPSEGESGGSGSAD